MLKESVKWALSLSVGGVVIALLGLGAFGGDSLMSSGGDLIGSLPISYPDGEGSITNASVVAVLMDGEAGEEGLVQADLAMTLRGTKANVEGAVSAAYGSGWVNVEKTKIAGEYVYVFHGNVTVELNRASLEGKAVGAGVRFGTQFQGGLAHVTWSKYGVGGFGIVDRQLDLPYGRVLLTGAVDAGEVGLSLLSLKRLTGRLELSVSGTTARIEMVSP